jgi:hypothetical protein
MEHCNDGIVMRIKKYIFLFAAVLLSFSSKKFKGLEIPNAKIWLRNFRKRALNSVGSSVFPMFKEFIKADIFIVRKINFKTNKNIIAICVIRNDLEKLKKFLEHHRKLGIKQFAFLDDHSSDGTKEFLLAQDDVELFESSDSFFTERKEAWINRILAYYGFNRWYAVLDSDELLVYDDCEEYKIDEFVALMEKGNITAASGKMIDMYFHNGTEYFDKIGYFDGEYTRFMPNPTGGMRYRVFKMQMYLGKTPLFFLDSKIIYHIHCLFPFEKNFQKKDVLALLHYKFLEGDLEKYKERASNESMYNGSEEYKQYIEKINSGDLSFYDENVSEKFVSSNTLVENKLVAELWRGGI